MNTLKVKKASSGLKIVDNFERSVYNKYTFCLKVARKNAQNLEYEVNRIPLSPGG